MTKFNEKFGNVYRYLKRKKIKKREKIKLKHLNIEISQFDLYYKVRENYSIYF